MPRGSRVPGSKPWQGCTVNFQELFSELSWPLTWNKGYPDTLTKVVLSGLLWGHWRLTSLPAPQGAIFHREVMLGVFLVLQGRT